MRPWSRHARNPHSRPSCPAKKTAANSVTLANGLAKVQAAREYDLAPIFAVTSDSTEKSYILRWHIAPWRHMKLCVAWIVLAELLTMLTTRSKKPPRLCYATKSKNRILPNLLLHVSAESLALSAELLDCDDLAHKDLPLQQNGERIEKAVTTRKISKFWMDAGFLNVVEIGQYFMTKDTTFLQVLLVKTSQHVKLRSVASLARKQRKRFLWLVAGIANEHSAIRNQC